MSLVGVFPAGGVPLQSQLSCKPLGRAAGQPGLSAGDPQQSLQSRPGGLHRRMSCHVMCHVTVNASGGCHLSAVHWPMQFVSGLDFPIPSDTGAGTGSSEVMGVHRTVYKLVVASLASSAHSVLCPTLAQYLCVSAM